MILLSWRTDQSLGDDSRRAMRLYSKKLARNFLGGSVFPGVIDLRHTGLVSDTGVWRLAARIEVKSVSKSKELPQFCWTVYSVVDQTPRTVSAVTHAVRQARPWWTITTRRSVERALVLLTHWNLISMQYSVLHSTPEVGTARTRVYTSIGHVN